MATHQGAASASSDQPGFLGRRLRWARGLAASLAFWRGRSAGDSGAARLGTLTTERGALSPPRPEVDPPALDLGAVEAAMREELYHRLLDALGRLDERHRQVLVWHRDEGLPYEEIGRRLGGDEGLAAVLHHRAIQRLQEVLADGSMGSLA